MTLKKLSRMGITEEVIKTKDTPDFPKATTKDARNQSAYKAKMVDVVIDAFYEDAAGMLEEIEKSEADIQQLQAQRQTMTAELNRLKEDIDQSALVDEKIDEFEKLMDVMETKLREAIDAREKDLHYVMECKESLQKATSEAEELKEKAEAADQLQAQVQTLQEQVQNLQERNHTLEQTIQDKDDQLIAFDEGYYKLERDINDIVNTFRNQLSDLGIEFGETQSEDNTSDEEMIIEEDLSFNDEMMSEMDEFDESSLDME